MGSKITKKLWAHTMSRRDISSSHSPSGLLHHSVTPGNLIHSVDSGRALASSWTLLSQTLRGSPAVFFSWPLPFCLRRYPQSDAEHHVLVLQGPGMLHGQTEIYDDNVGCHQQLRRERLSLEHICVENTGPGIYWVSVVETSRGMPPECSCRWLKGSMCGYSELIWHANQPHGGRPPKGIGSTALPINIKQETDYWMISYGKQNDNFNTNRLRLWNW